MSFSGAMETVTDPLRILGGSGLGGYISGTSAAHTQYKYQKKLMAKQAAYNQALQDDSQEFNSAEAQKTRDYETEMSNSAYQRQKADLLAAGYNPLLAINSGGASTPTVGAATSAASSVSSGQAGMPQTRGFSDIMSMVGSIGQIAKLGSEIRSNNATTALNNAHADLLGQQSEESSAKTALYSAQAQKQALENANFDPESHKRKQKYGEGPFGLTHTIGGVADDVAKGASKIVNHVDGLQFKAWQPSSNTARGVNAKIQGYEDELGKILDKVLDERKPDTNKRKGGARAASSWLPSHF